ncbi:MAG: universal stress protein [Methanomassiliicoccaceae archaeon]|jgi:nucleotide-binding universal stress UspA family protein|nr:universal stress protein [Methanomassiliicoccaceae archaeon]
MTPFKKMLIATDGSRSTEGAVLTGLELAKLVGASVTALNVIDGPVLLSGPADSEMAAIYAILEKEGRAAVERVKELGASMGVAVDAKVISGHPVKVILDESAGHDLIIVGSLGRTGMAKILIGSVAEKVVKLAKCPVMVVRNKGDGQ